MKPAGMALAFVVVLAVSAYGEGNEFKVTVSGMS